MRAGNRLGLSSHSFPAERLLKSLRKSRFQRLLKAAYKHKWCIQTHGRKKETQSPTTYALQLVAWHSPHLTGPIDEILQDVLVAKSHGGEVDLKKKGGLGWENKHKSRLAIYCTVIFWLMICLLHHIIFRFRAETLDNNVLCLSRTHNQEGRGWKQIYSRTQ